MMSTIEVPNDDGKNFGGVETKLNVTKRKKPVKVHKFFSSRNRDEVFDDIINEK